MTQTSSDKKFAEALCHEKSWAKKQFQDDYVTFLTWTALSIVHYGIPREKWPVDIGGTTFMVSDESMEAYTWLSQQAIRESCAYRGDSNCSFDSYIKGVLRSHKTRNNWINTKKGAGSGLVSTPVPKFIPECISRLSPLHIEVLTALRYKKDRNSICSKNKITESEYEKVFNEIVRILHSEDYGSLIKEISYETDEGEIKRLKTRPLTPPDMLEISQYSHAINKTLEMLNKSKRRLIYQYWSGLSVDEIFKNWSKTPSGQKHLRELQITSSKNIYARVTKISEESLTIFKEVFPIEFKESNMTLPRLKRVFSTYINYYLYPDNVA
jgi:hypothetical protein|tara:strand:+ start:302 stop:1276 length:975 start_codon:yes stop_codon:yes gene_type:complete